MSRFGEAFNYLFRESSSEHNRKSTFRKKKIHAFKMNVESHFPPISMQKRKEFLEMADKDKMFGFAEGNNPYLCCVHKYKIV